MAWCGEEQAALAAAMAATSGWRWSEWKEWEGGEAWKMEGRRLDH
jgi:hypothetical protein